jgi:hypothetical protein
VAHTPSITCKRFHNHRTAAFLQAGMFNYPPAEHSNICVVLAALYIYMSVKAKDKSEDWQTLGIWLQNYVRHVITTILM